VEESVIALSPVPGHVAQHVTVGHDRDGIGVVGVGGLGPQLDHDPPSLLGRALGSQRPGQSGQSRRVAGLAVDVVVAAPAVKHEESP
jgi:hypothetical protein